MNVAKLLCEITIEMGSESKDYRGWLNFVRMMK